MTDPLAGLRQQYHVMPEKGGKDRGKKAWDVYRLIEPSAELPVEQVAVDAIAARRVPVDPEPDHRNCRPSELDYTGR